MLWFFKGPLILIFPLAFRVGCQAPKACSPLATSLQHFSCSLSLSFQYTLNMENEKTMVRFVCCADQVEFGQDLAIVGSTTELGEWQPNQALSMTWQENRWVAETSLPTQSTIELKVLKRMTHDKEILSWNGLSGEANIIMNTTSGQQGRTSFKTYEPLPFSLEVDDLEDGSEDQDEDDDEDEDDDTTDAGSPQPSPSCFEEAFPEIPPHCCDERLETWIEAENEEEEEEEEATSSGNASMSLEEGGNASMSSVEEQAEEKEEGVETTTPWTAAADMQVEKTAMTIHMPRSTNMVSIAVGTVFTGSLGCSAGAAAGTTTGALLGLPFAFVTMGLSIPAGAILLGSAGAAAGGVTGSITGAALAYHTGFNVSWLKAIVEGLPRLFYQQFAPLTCAAPADTPTIERATLLTRRPAMTPKMFEACLANRRGAFGPQG